MTLDISIIYYGDFEAYSNEIKKRLKITEKNLLKRLKQVQ